jgi:hypothetical protein
MNASEKKPGPLGVAARVGYSLRGAKGNSFYSAINSPFASSIP